MYPPNPTANRPVGERGKGKMSIKGGEVQQVEGFSKIKRRSLERESCSQ